MTQQTSAQGPAQSAAPAFNPIPLTDRESLLNSIAIFFAAIQRRPRDPYALEWHLFWHAKHSAQCDATHQLNRLGGLAGAW